MFENKKNSKKKCIFFRLFIISVLFFSKPSNDFNFFVFKIELGMLKLIY